MGNTIENYSNISPNTYQGEEVRMCKDGKYRWKYEMSLFRNPTIFLTTLKVMMLSVGIVWLFGLVIFLFDGDLDHIVFWTKLTGIMIGIFVVLTMISILILAAIYGGKYVALFEMDENGVTHTQIPSQAKKSKIIGLITALVGIFAKNPTTSGAGTLSMANDSRTADFARVRRVKSRRRMNLIKVNQLLFKNQVYVAKEDFDFVYDFIKSHCPNAK